MSALRPPVYRRKSSFSKTLKTDSVCSGPFSDKTCTSIQSLDRSQKMSVNQKTDSESLKNGNQGKMMKNTSRLVERIEKLHRSFVRNRKKSERKFSADERIGQDLQVNEEMLRRLRDQVLMAKYLETDKFSDYSSIRIDDLDNSFDSIDSVFHRNRRNSLGWKEKAFVASIVLIKLN
jgi:hypothetical protein